jgi:hypothetical protein
VGKGPRNQIGWIDREGVVAVWWKSGGGGGGAPWTGGMRLRWLHEQWRVCFGLGSMYVGRSGWKPTQAVVKGPSTRQQPDEEERRAASVLDTETTRRRRLS